MKREISITYIEIEKWLKENQENIVNSIIKKIKQREKIFYFKLFKGRNQNLIIYLPYFLFFSNSSIRVEKPTNFQMVLRKYAEDKRIEKVYQREMDKIVIFELSNKIKLIFEFFSDGNIIIVDENGKIIDALVKRDWKDRSINRNVEYKFPPLKNLIKKNFQEIFEICKNSDLAIFKFLIENFGLNSYYAQAILETLKIDKNKNCKEISQRELDLILKSIEEILKSKEFYIKKNDFIWIGSLNISDSIRIEKINDAFLEGFSILEKKKIIKKEKEKEEKVKKIFEAIEESKRKIMEEISEISEKIDVIQNNYSLISEISEKILALRGMNVDWQDIKNIIKKQYKEVLEINEHLGSIKLKFGEKEITLSFRDLKGFLNKLFERRKKLKEKLSKIEERKKEEIKIEVEKESFGLALEKEEKEQKQWYEKFRWFISSDGFLVVSGKDAESNEELIKKYVREQDIIFHADIHGSPFTVIRNDKKQNIPLQTIYEAAQFTACYSQAWDLGLGNINVYYVRPNQLVKSNLPKGSFLITGERIWLEKVKLRLAIGVYEEKGKVKIFAAPPVAARKKTQYIITLVPGNRSADELVKEIRKHFESNLPFEIRALFEKVSDEEIKRLIPFSKGELVRVI
ncbi:MAG: ribosome rescue protein RqcH [Candidatus Aenigmatarchaeota archaeon]